MSSSSRGYYNGKYLEIGYIKYIESIIEKYLDNFDVLSQFWLKYKKKMYDYL